jgi:hypothetical protein
MQALIDGGQREMLRELKQLQHQATGLEAVDPLHTNSVELLDGSLAPRLRP